VVNANYLMKKLQRIEGFEVKFSPEGPCKHEFVLSAEPLKRKTGVTARDVAKRLLDFGVHAPTYYFPPIVPEALMIEPTETEPKEELDGFVEIFGRISEEAAKNPELLKRAHSELEDVLAPVGEGQPAIVTRGSTDNIGF
ncbi:MAG: hypothetical protein QXH08_01270, partial [Candidatus Hadarchaeales archaeon]